jgi:hypothetical protein
VSQTYIPSVTVKCKKNARAILTLESLIPSYLSSLICPYTQPNLSLGYLSITYRRIDVLFRAVYLIRLTVERLLSPRSALSVLGVLHPKVKL